MSVVLAAIDDSAAAKPVMAAAHELAPLFGAHVEAVHVDEADSRTASAIAGAMHVPLHRRRGDVASSVEAAAKERDAVAVVIGARRLPGGRSPAGHVATALVQTLDIAVVVVPPQARSRPIQRVLIAVEGDGESHALRHLVGALRHGPAPAMVAMHVFEPDRLPAFGDQPVLETEAWTEEFGRRTLRSIERPVQLEVRVGEAGRVICDTARELDVDLVALAWHGDLASGHGRIVRRLLADADVPLLLTRTKPMPQLATG
jgi:nucleotide-binding universal stress UspA family protein